MYQPECNLVYQYDASGAIIGFTYYPYSGTATQYFFGKNAQGDVICIYDTSGTTVARYNYDAWGACTIAYDNTSIGIANINPIRYRSYYYDTETGWYYLQSRYYDPAVGRFISPDDPSLLGSNGDLLSYNLYAYCSNNPVNYSDPSGHSFLLTILVGSLIGFTISATSSIIGQYMATQDWTQINFWEVLYDGAWGALYGALACTNISTLGSVLVGMGCGFISSIGQDYLFLGAEFELREAILNAVINGVIGGVVGLIGGPGSRASIEKYIHTRTVLRSTLGKHGQTVLFRQTRSVFKHAKDLLISGVRYFVGNFSAGTISKQEFYTI